MTEVTSADSKPDSPPESKFPKITDWKLSLFQEDHIARFMQIILESVYRSLPPDEIDTPTLRANITGALVDGRVQVWGILGFVPSEDQWRPVGYMTTSIRANDIADIKTLFIYTMFSFVVIEDSAYGIFFDTLKEYCRHEKCTQISCLTNSERVLRMLRLHGWNTEYTLGYHDLEKDSG